MTTTLQFPAPISTERMAELLRLGVAPDIAVLDLEMVKMKLRDPEEGAGWSQEQCESAEVEYKRFLHLNRKFKDQGIVPNRIMDTMWHFHILDTRRYVLDSERLFGGYFHHYPYFGMRGDEDRENLIRAFEETKRLYEREFGEPMTRVDANDCWHDCQGRCWHACSNDDVRA